MAHLILLYVNNTIPVEIPFDQLHYWFVSSMSKSFNVPEDEFFLKEGASSLGPVIGLRFNGCIPRGVSLTLMETIRASMLGFLPGQPFSLLWIFLLFVVLE